MIQNKKKLKNILNIQILNKTQIYYKKWFIFKIKEQQKLRELYGNISINRLKRIYKKIIYFKNNFIYNFIKFLEYRLDIVLYRMNYFINFKLINYNIKYGNIFINKKCVKNMNYFVKIYDIITIAKYKYHNNLYIIKNTIDSKPLLNLLILQLFKLKKIKYANFLITNGFIYLNNKTIKIPHLKIVAKKLHITIKYNKQIKKYFINRADINIYKNIYKKKKSKEILNLKKLLINNFFYSYITIDFEYLFEINNKSANIKILKKKYFNYNNYKMYKVILKKKKIFYINNVFIFDMENKKKKIGLFINKKVYKISKFMFYLNFDNFHSYIITKTKKKYIHRNTKIRYLYSMHNKSYNKKILHKVQHLEHNYKLRSSILINLFNIDSIGFKDFLYLNFLSYYFFMYN